MGWQVLNLSPGNLHFDGLSLVTLRRLTEDPSPPPTVKEPCLQAGKGLEDVLETPAGTSSSLEVGLAVWRGMQWPGSAGLGSRDTWGDEPFTHPKPQELTIRQEFPEESPALSPPPAISRAVATLLPTP